MKTSFARFFNVHNEICLNLVLDSKSMLKNPDKKQQQPQNIGILSLT